MLSFAIRRIWILASHETSGTAQGRGLTVPTAQGPVIGAQVLPEVRQWLGIPFATAARWTAPSLPPTRPSPFNANTFGNSCYQVTNPATDKYLEFARQNETLTESENCLTLNIWAPSTSRPQNAAVLIWIYGGGFQFGASALKVYDGRNFARDSDSLILVTFNYRLNIFGQPNAPQLVHPTNSQNFGLLDQKAAIDWVKDNIAAFGGNPDRISLFGHSAGAVSADIYTQAYPTDATVKGIILQSGNMNGLVDFDLGSPTLDDAPWNTVAAAVGCGTSPTPAQYTCMQEAAAAALIQAAKAIDANFRLVTDDIVIHSDWASRMASGRFSKIPTILGTVQHEGDALAVPQELVARGNAPPFITTLLADIITQVNLNCGVAKSAKDRFNNGVTTWRYHYQAFFPGISTRQDLRAFHGSELPIIFGTFGHSSPTPIEIALSSYTKNAWSAFAKNPSAGLTKIGWPSYNPTTDTLVQLGNVVNLDGASLASPALLDATCPSASILLGIHGQLTTLLDAI